MFTSFVRETWILIAVVLAPQAFQWRGPTSGPHLEFCGFAHIFHRYEVEELIKAYHLEGKDMKKRLLLPEKIKLTIQAMLEQLRVFKCYKCFSLYCCLL